MVVRQLYNARKKLLPFIIYLLFFFLIKLFYEFENLLLKNVVVSVEFRISIERFVYNSIRVKLYFLRNAKNFEYNIICFCERLNNIYKYYEQLIVARDLRQTSNFDKRQIFFENIFFFNPVLITYIYVLKYLSIPGTNAC